MAAPVQDVRIWDIQDRTRRSNASRPWILRWKVDGAERSRAFKTKAEADHVRARLVVAARDGETFDRGTGLPLSWQPRPADRRLHEWMREWLAEQWPEWQPRTRRSAVEALSRFVPAVRPASVSPAPTELRRYLIETLVPGAAVDGANRCERWMRQWSPPLNELSLEMIALAEREMATGLKGQQLGAAVVGRYRKVAHSALLRAVDLGILERDPWPPPPRGRRTRKATRRRPSVDVRRLPGPHTMTTVLEAIPTHQPGSQTYQVMTAIAYYAGLRPSEVVMLRVQALTLPEKGWGQIAVVEADIDWDEPGEPKTGERTVPIPPVLVSMLRAWVRGLKLEGSDLLFRTRHDNRPTPSNWSRALKRAYTTVGHPPLRVYDCRHAAATTWLRAGVPLRVVAMRLGHSVETLVSTYVGALEGDDLLANQRIEEALKLTATELSDPELAAEKHRGPHE
jgi:integrase